MKLSKIVILGGRNDFEKFSFAVSRDFIQEFMYILWLDTEIFSQPFLLISTGDFSIATSPLIPILISPRHTQDGPFPNAQNTFDKMRRGISDDVGIVRVGKCQGIVGNIAWTRVKRRNWANWAIQKHFMVSKLISCRAQLQLSKVYYPYASYLVKIY